MKINTDYRVRKAIADLWQLFENFQNEQLPDRDQFESRLEEFADAILECTVSEAVKKVKTQVMQQP